MNTKVDLVNKLRQTRRGNTEYSQQQLADIVGCTRQTIIALEQNKYNPSLFLALKLAKALKLQVEDIFKIKEQDTW